MTQIHCHDNSIRFQWYALYVYMSMNSNLAVINCFDFSLNKYYFDFVVNFGDSAVRFSNSLFTAQLFNSKNDEHKNIKNLKFVSHLWSFNCVDRFPILNRIGNTKWKSWEIKTQYNTIYCRSIPVYNWIVFYRVLAVLPLLLLHLILLASWIQGFPPICFQQMILIYK